MKKLTGETKLLLIMGLIVLLGGGFLALAPQNQDSPLPPGQTPVPEATPKSMTKDEFEKLLNAPGAHVEGSPTADLAVIEFGDVECSSCRYAFDKFGHKFGKEVSAQLSFHHLPLDIHQFGKPCALALEAADMQGKFWPLFDALFTDQSAALSEDFIQTKARNTGLDLAKFEADRKGAEAAERVKADIALGEKMGVTRTPTFFVLNRKDGTVKVAVGPREFMKAFQGIPGIPTPEPERPKLSPPKP